MSNPPSDRSHDERHLPLIVYCSGNLWTSPVGTDRQVVSRLAKSFRILYVDPALSIRPRNSDLLRGPALEQIGDNLWRLSPKAPPGTTRLLGRSVAATLTKRAIRRSVKSLGGSVHAIVVSSLDPLLDTCEAACRLFYGTDDFRAGATLMRLSQRWVERREVEQLAAASRVIAVSDQLADRWRDLGFEVFVIPNGCDVEGFSQTDMQEAASDINLPPPIAGLVGLINDRIDLAMLEAVADMGISLLLVGPVSEPIDRQRFDELVDRDNVQWVGRRAFEQIPSYLKAVSVGLTPYTDTEFNRSSSPLKTLEYLAAGRAVVASDLPAARRLGTDLVTIARTPAEFALRVSEQLSSDDGAELRMRRREFAAMHGWDRRVDEFRGVIGPTAP